jgi:hypothetical protein
MKNIKSITVVYHNAMDNVTFTVGSCGVLAIQDMLQEWNDGITRRYDVVKETGTIQIEECSVIVEN